MRVRRHNRPFALILLLALSRQKRRGRLRNAGGELLRQRGGAFRGVSKRGKPETIGQTCIDSVRDEMN